MQDGDDDAYDSNSYDRTRYRKGLLEMVADAISSWFGTFRVDIGGNHLPNTTRLTQVFFKRGKQCSNNYGDP